MAKSKGINLLPQGEFDASIIGRVLKWATGTFRIIVIVTEMVVMAAFLSRFWLDAQNSDLTDSIKIKSSQIEAQADFEKQFREVQKKLAIFKALASDTTSSQKIDLIASKTPGDIVLDNITQTQNSIQIKGSSVSELAVAQMIANLKSEKTFKDVGLVSLNSQESSSGGLVFVLKVDY